MGTIKTKDFIVKIAPYAREYMFKYNIKASLTIAQAILESASGNKDIGANNLFGMKWYEGCGYDYVIADTKEWDSKTQQYKTVKAKFKKYDSWEQSIQDHAELFLKDRYKKVIMSRDFWEATQAVKDCGYATSPSYTDNLRRVILSWGLYHYDWITNPDSPISTCSPNFKWKESYSTVRFGGKDYQDVIEPYEEYVDNVVLTAMEIQKLRDYINLPLVINSWWRTPYYNAVLSGSSKKSQHLLGLAVDVKCPRGIRIDDLLSYAKKVTNFKWYKVYYKDNFIHMDLRKK